VYYPFQLGGARVTLDSVEKIVHEAQQAVMGEE
jgi:hypothetical protein